MHIVGSNITRLVARAKAQQRLIDGLQFGNVVLLKFEEEVVRSEDVVIPVQLLAGSFRALFPDDARNFSRHAAGGSD